MKKVLEKKTPKSVNSDLDELKEMQDSLDSLQSKMGDTREIISASFSQCVVMFVDLVGSTDFKLKNSDSVWILRVKLFVDVISQYTQELGGNVVKIIGDEVMIIFTRKEQNNDAQNFVMRVKEIENVLLDITGYKTRIKIALDCGSVCFIKYEGNDALDPQGTPVDRCARISKYCEEGTVLTSEYQYLQFEHKDLWHFIGKPNLKGIGNTSIYQLGSKTIEAEDTKTVTVKEYEYLKDFEGKYRELVEQNKRLQLQIKEAGEKPDHAASVESESEWSEIEEIIKEINVLIDNGPGYGDQYARFLFLYEIGDSDKQNRFEGKDFDELIQSNIVYSEHDNGWFAINSNHKRNSKVQTKIYELEKMIDSYVDVYGELDDADLFDYSVKDPEFWEKYIGYTVV